MITLTSKMQGFTLVETLVAIAILMIAIVAPFYSIQQSITTSYVTRDQLIATSLAQEGVEYIYYLRDTNYLTPGNSWTQGMAPCFTQGGCIVDPSTGSISACGNGGGCAPLNLTSGGIYTQGGSSPTTRFTRTVKATTISVNQIEVTSQVSWTTNHSSFTTTVTEELYNWI
ncbi:MAG: seg [Parcubacteria group bacterium]|nr:seg [Parcubacteria group bacterium]